MRIKTYAQDDVVILEPVGKLMPGQAVGKLDEKLYALLGRGQKRVIIDLGNTIQIGSSAISVLLHHHTKFREIGGNLKLANLTKSIREIIAITRLTLVFEVFDGLREAQESFAEPLPRHKGNEPKTVSRNS